MGFDHDRVAVLAATDGTEEELVMKKVYITDISWIFHALSPLPFHRHALKFPEHVLVSRFNELVR